MNAFFGKFFTYSITNDFWHYISVIVNSVCVNTKNRKKTGKNATRFCWCLQNKLLRRGMSDWLIDWLIDLIDWYIYIYDIYIYIYNREGNGLRPTSLFKWRVSAKSTEKQAQRKQMRYFKVKIQIQIWCHHGTLNTYYYTLPVFKPLQYFQGMSLKNYTTYSAKINFFIFSRNICHLNSYVVTTVKLMLTRKTGIV